MRSLKLLISVFLLSSFVQAQYSNAKISELSLNKRWLRMNLYRSSTWGGYVSQIRDPNFFLSPDGRDNPEAELRATLVAFKLPVTEENIKKEIVKVIEDENKVEEHTESHALATHALCKFPARLRFVKEHFPDFEKELPKIACNRLEAFKNRTQTVKVSFVFSSYFVGNPSSTFGHTLLRLHNKNFVNSKSELLDTAISFAAVPTTSNPVLYAVYGLAGMFPGTFTAVPYYRKVREYNDYESRDLWTYELNLTQNEIDWLVDILWEVGDTYLNYYYFTVNCASILLDILDAAAPRLNLVDRTPFYVIPSDTVRAINQEPGFVTKRSYRPSMRQQFKARVALLTPEEKTALWSLMEGKSTDTLLAYSDASKISILDSWSDFVEFKHSKELSTVDSPALELKQKVLLARAEILKPSPEIIIEGRDEDAPHNAHGIRRFSLGVGYSKERFSMMQARMRFALQALTDPSVGYPRNNEINFFEFAANIYPEQKKWLDLEEITLFKIANMNPWSAYEKSLSFRAGLGLYNKSDPDFENPLSGNYGTAYGGVGLTFSVFSDIIPYVFVQAHAEGSPDFRQSFFRLSAGPHAGFVVHFSALSKMILETYYHHRWSSTEPNLLETLGEMQFGFSNSMTCFVAGRANKIDQRLLGGMRWFF